MLPALALLMRAGAMAAAATVAPELLVLLPLSLAGGRRHHQRAIVVKNGLVRGTGHACTRVYIHGMLARSVELVWCC